MAASPHPVTGPVEFRLLAPLYDNSLSSGFFGDATLRIERGQVTVTALRSGSQAGGQFMGAGLIIGFFALASAITGLAGLAGLHPASSSANVGSLATGGVLAALALAYFLRGRHIAERGALVESVTFPLQGLRGRKAAFDWNIGCGLALLLTPVGSLAVMLARGRRIVRLRAPIGPGGAPRTLSLRARSASEGLALDQALRGT